MKGAIQLIWNELKSIFIPKREDDPLRDLKSSDTIRKERYLKFRRRVMALFIILPIIFFFGYVAIKTFFIYTEQRDKSQVTKTIPKKDLKLEFNTFTRWQEIKDQEDEKLNKDIGKLSVKVENVKKEVFQKIDDSGKVINDNLETIKEQMNKSLENNQKSLKELLTEERKKNKDALNGVIENFNGQLKSVESDVKIKLKDLAVSKQKSNVSIKLPKLPSLNNSTEMASNNLKEKDMFKKNPAPTLDDIEISKEVVYDEEEIEEEVYKVSTLSNFTKKEEESDNTMPELTIMPGFLKGVIVAGADVPTLEQSSTEPKPIWLSINSDQLIANSKISNMKDCLLEAIATGDIGTKRGRFALKTLSCSLTDLDGNDYKIVTPIKGNIYGEDGKIGAKGRLVSREGEIIQKGVPLAVLEGLIQTLSKANTYIYPSGSGVSGDENPLSNFSDGGANTGSKILSKFSDYYLKILESMNPYIEIKAKRVVTVAISDAVVVKPVKYTPFDVNYFVERDLLEDEDEYEEDY